MKTPFIFLVPASLIIAQLRFTNALAWTAIPSPLAWPLASIILMAILSVALISKAPHKKTSSFIQRHPLVTISLCIFAIGPLIALCMPSLAAMIPLWLSLAIQIIAALMLGFVIQSIIAAIYGTIGAQATHAKKTSKERQGETTSQKDEKKNDQAPKTDDKQRSRQPNLKTAKPTATLTATPPEGQNIRSANGIATDKNGPNDSQLETPQGTPAAQPKSNERKASTQVNRSQTTDEKVRAKPSREVMIAQPFQQSLKTRIKQLATLIADQGATFTGYGLPLKKNIQNIVDFLLPKRDGTLPWLYRAPLRLLPAGTLPEETKERTSYIKNMVEAALTGCKHTSQNDLLLLDAAHPVESDQKAKPHADQIAMSYQTRQILSLLTQHLWITDQSGQHQPQLLLPLMASPQSHTTGNPKILSIKSANALNAMKNKPNDSQLETPQGTPAAQPKSEEKQDTTTSLTDEKTVNHERKKADNLPQQLKKSPDDQVDTTATLTATPPEVLTENVRHADKKGPNDRQLETPQGTPAPQTTDEKVQAKPAIVHKTAQEPPAPTLETCNIHAQYKAFILRPIDALQDSYNKIGEMITRYNHNEKTKATKHTKQPRKPFLNALIFMRIHLNTKRRCVENASQTQIAFQARPKPSREVMIALPFQRYYRPKIKQLATLIANKGATFTGYGLPLKKNIQNIVDFLLPNRNGTLPLFYRTALRLLPAGTLPEEPKERTSYIKNMVEAALTGCEHISQDDLLLLETVQSVESDQKDRPHFDQIAMSYHTRQILPLLIQLLWITDNKYQQNSKLQSPLMEELAPILRKTCDHNPLQLFFGYIEPALLALSKQGFAPFQAKDFAFFKERQTIDGILQSKLSLPKEYLIQNNPFQLSHKKMKESCKKKEWLTSVLKPQKELHALFQSWHKSQDQEILRKVTEALKTHWLMTTKETMERGLSTHDIDAKESKNPCPACVGLTHSLPAMIYDAKHINQNFDAKPYPIPKDRIIPCWQSLIGKMMPSARMLLPKGSIPCLKMVIALLRIFAPNEDQSTLRQVYHMMQPALEKIILPIKKSLAAHPIHLYITPPSAIGTQHQGTSLDAIKRSFLYFVQHQIYSICAFCKLHDINTNHYKISVILPPLLSAENSHAYDIEETFEVAHCYLEHSSQHIYPSKEHSRAKIEEYIGQKLLRD